jgi:hypothetical protein
VKFFSIGLFNVGESTAMAAHCIFCRSPSNVPRKHFLAWDISLSWHLACVLMRLYITESSCEETNLMLYVTLHICSSSLKSYWSLGVFHLRRYVQIGCEVHVVSCPICTNLFSCCFRDGPCSYLSWGLTCSMPYFCVHVRLQLTFRESCVHNESQVTAGVRLGCMATVGFPACEPEFHFLSQSVETACHPASCLL